MTVAKRFRYLVGILIGVAIIVSGAAISALYTAALSEERERLRELAQSQVRLIEAIARFGTVNSGENNPEAAAEAAAATISQVIDAHKRLRGFGASGEFLFGRPEGDSFVFLKQPRFNDASNEPIPFASGLAEPMRRALYGQAGTMVGPDYRGVTVLAAYEPIAVLGAGLVAKIDLAELRAPFIRAGAISLGILVAAVLLGIVLFRALLQPVKEEFEQIIGNFRRAERVAGIGSWRWDAAANVVEWSDEIYRMYRVDRETLEVNYETGIAFIHPEDRSRVDHQMRRALADGKPYRIEHRFLRADGEVRHAEQHCHVEFGVDGNPQRILGTIQDITDRKNAEVELRESEERLNAFFVDAPAGLVIVDRDLCYVKVNETLARLHGRSPADHVGRPMREISPHVADVMTPLFTQVLETGEPIVNFEYEGGVPGPDGIKSATVTSIFPVLGADGMPHGVGAISTDITERKRAEQALRESEERWRLFMDSATEHFVLYDADLNVIDINAVTLESLGWKKEDVIGRNMVDVFPAAATTGRLKMYHEVLDTGEPFEMETAVDFGNGRLGQIVMRVFKAGDGLGISSADITERKKAEAALRESEERLNAFFADAPAELVMFDRELRFLKVNETLARVNGVPAEDHIGKPIRDIAPDLAPKVEPLLRRVLETAEPILDLELAGEVTTDPGNEHTWASSMFPILDGEGRPQGIGSISIDITGRKRAERELELLNRRLEELVTDRTSELRATQDELINAERLAALGQLTATVAHELRNPLATIRTSVFSLRSKIPGSADEVERPFQRIDRNIARCDRIIAELLDFSANQEPNLETVDLNQCVAAWVDDYRASEGARLRLAISDSTAMVRIDQDRLHQVIVNLLDNAAQAQEEAPGRPRRDAEIAVRTQVEGGHFILEVADDGPGIPDDVLPRIFEPLFSTKGFGVGLGLPLVKKIIDQHGGDIEVVTGVGDGTTFRIRLPLAKSKEAAA